MQLFYKLNWYFLKEWKKYISAIILLITISLLQLIPPKLMGTLIDTIVKKKHSSDKIFYIVISIFIISTIVYILRYMWRVLLFGASYKLAINLRSKIYKFLSIQNSDFYLKNKTGDLMAKSTNDVDRVVSAAGEGVLTLVDSIVIGSLVLLVMIFQINFYLTIISLLPMPIMAYIVKKYGEKLHKKFKKSQNAFSLLNNNTQESLTSIRMIRSYGLEKIKLKKFKKVIKNVGKKNIEVSKVDALFDPIIHISISISNLLAIILGGILVIENKITLGELTSFIMYLGLMMWPMLALAWMFNIAERGKVSLLRIQKIINIKKEKKKSFLNLPKYYKNLKIKIYKFSYKNSKNIILKNIYFKIKLGNVIGICGPIGSGKTTLLNIIQNNLNLIKGKVLYNNVCIKNIKKEEWKSNLSVVNQNNFLFSDTIKNNILIGNLNASKKEIKKVAKLSYIHKDILDFPKKYETKIGEKGIMLSGGQKQRLSIARALLTNSKIIILDDSLSAVDEKTENKILKNLSKNKEKNKTIILVSHKLSTLINADKIIVLKNGKIDQIGNHYELIKDKKWYYKMFKYQQLKKKFKKETNERD
ncbi:ABC transporter transmembrane domain-containing protein [Buchnera aphidicola (Pseudoregma panicola)]|uniref:ABC transporter transmembrane domain-containing protein n=1 Tax=Buchnera aphidicola TaxID=9 RepID=UPI0031B7063D